MSSVNGNGRNVVYPPQPQSDAAMEIGSGVPYEPASGPPSGRRLYVGPVTDSDLEQGIVRVCETVEKPENHWRMPEDDWDGR